MFMFHISRDLTDPLPGVYIMTPPKPHTHTHRGGGVVRIVWGVEEDSTAGPQKMGCR